MDDSIDQRAIKWLVSDDTGISSKTLCAFMLGATENMRWKSPPSDADDRGRCIRLLEKIPEWIPRLHELETLEHQTSYVVDTFGVRTEDNSWAKQIILIRQEMKNATN